MTFTTGCLNSLNLSHRLSTITHANQILVLHQGTIVEKGTHETLLELNGRYASMWNRQAKAEKAAEDARNATRKAEKLMRKANIPPPSGDHHNRTERSNGHDDSSSSSDESVTPSRPGSQFEPITSVEGYPRSTH